MSVELIHGLYDYHRWANRRLYDVATALGEELASRDVGKQFSYTTIRRMFGHLYGADRIWLARWTGVTVTTIPGIPAPTCLVFPGSAFAAFAMADSNDRSKTLTSRG